MPRTGRPKGEMIRLQCAHCGKEVERHPSTAKRNTTGRVFCSIECRNTLGCKPRRKSEVACQFCEVVFYPASGNLNKFCSKDCYDGWQRRNREKRTCEVCGTQFEQKPSQVAHNTGRWCSRACLGRAKSTRALGRDHNGKPALLSFQGYVKVWEPEHPNGRSGWVLEHRLVVERVLGRYLEPGEHVHHKNGDRTDNRPENLEVMSARDHSALTAYERALKEQREREELEEYRRRFGPLT